jgi:hypothetical protein
MAQTNFRASDMIGAVQTVAPVSPKAAKKAAAPAPKKAEAPVVEVVAEEAPAEETE